MFYDGYIQNTIIDLDAIYSLKEKLAYLHKEKRRFAAGNKGQDADIVLAWFADEIHKVEDMVVAEAKSIILNEMKRHDDLPGQLKYLYQEYESYIDSGTGSDEIMSWLQQKIALTEKKNENVTQPGKRTSKLKRSYRWQGTPEELTALYQKMTGSVLIDKHTPENVFKALFEATPLDGITPVQWSKKPVLLAYFIHRLSIANNKISSSDDHWQIAERCFLVSNEHPKNLKQSYNNSANNKTGLPKQHELVDDLF